MHKVKGIYQGIFALSFMFLLAASFICISLLRLCTDDWFPRNLTIGFGAEVIIFIWGVMFLKKGASEVLKESHSIMLVKELYVRVAYLMVFGITFALIILFFHYLSGSMDGYSPDSILVYSLNIIVPALFFLIWTLLGIARINRIMRY